MKVQRMEGSNINGIELLVPDGFNDLLPESPYPEYFVYEHYSFLGLKKLISPGSIVFDIGASCGVMSCLISRLCRSNGKVFAFEANSYAIKRAKEIVNANKISNINFINKFVGGKSGEVTDLFIIPGTQSAASTGNPEILKFHPDAVRSKVDVLAIDDFVQKSGVVPEVCNIDIEGAEYVAVNGMQRLLSNHQVDLVIETRSDEMHEIGGNLDTLIQELQRFGYQMIDLITRTIVDRKEFVDQYSKTIGHLLLSKKLKNREFINKFLTRATEEITSNPSLLDLTINSIQQSLESGDYANGKQLPDLLKKMPNHPRINYLYALSLQLQNKDPQKALRHYSIALNNGFDEYWVKYNRSALLADLGQVKAALTDAERLLRLKPGEQGTISIVERIRSLQQR
ncbi:MAG: FkbM family methyltransferase [Thermoproteota archaeon]|nr:FkbM family methyltransferase [Thermoproteota archaeon]